MKFAQNLLVIFWILCLLAAFLVYLVPRSNFKSFWKRNNSDIAFFLVLVAALSGILLWPAFLNHYPLVFPDTNGYIFGHAMDRSAGYYLFIKLSSFGSSLWYTVFVQSLLTVFLLMRIPCVLLAGIKFKEIISLTAVIGVMALSSIAKYVCWVIPDIMASWFFLGGVLFFLSNKWYDRVLAIGVITCSMACHNANVLTAFLVVPLVYAAAFASRKSYPLFWKISKAFAVIILLILVSISLLNLVQTSNFSVLSPRKSQFLFAKFSSYGLLSESLDQYCVDRMEKKICSEKEILKNGDGKDVGWFLWAKKSPYVSLRLFSRQEEVTDLTWFMFTSNIRRIILRSIEDTFSLFSRFNVNYGIEAKDSRASLHAVKARFHKEYQSARESRQARGLPLWITVFPFSQTVLEYLAVFYAAALIFLSIWKKDKALQTLCGMLFIFLFLHALVNASVSGVCDRYNTSVIWLLEYILFVAIAWIAVKGNHEQNIQNPA